MNNFNAEYTASLEETAPGITDIVNSQAKPGESWTDVLPRALTALVATEQQRQILKIQVERAKQGLPPLDASQFGVGVNVGLSPEITKMLAVGGAALLAVIYLTRKR